MDKVGIAKPKVVPADSMDNFQRLQRQKSEILAWVHFK